MCHHFTYLATFGGFIVHAKGRNTLRLDKIPSLLDIPFIASLWNDKMQIGAMSEGKKLH